MSAGDTLILAGLFLLAAALYSSVGHAGASGYLAAMALVGMAPDGMRVTALALNVLVATIGTVSYMRAGHFDWRTFYPPVEMTISPLFHRPFSQARNPVVEVRRSGPSKPQIPTELPTHRERVLRAWQLARFPHPRTPSR
jgi:hypothetical protein